MSDVSKPFVVNRASSIADVEDLLLQLKGAPENQDLLLATSLKRRQLGGTTAMLQLLSTWRRQCPQGRLRAHIGSESTQEQQVGVENFLTTDHGLFAWAMAGQLMARDGEADLSQMAQSNGDKRLEKMGEIRKAKRGNKVFLLCVDHRRRFAAPETLYQPSSGDEDEPALRSREGFKRLAEELRAEIGGRTARARRGRRSEEDTGLAVLLRELITNTHDWARRAPGKGSYASSLRGVRIELHNLALGELNGLTAEPVLREHLGRTEPNIGDRIHLVELSVFDCGPGLAAWRLQEINQESESRSLGLEYRAVRDCLQRHFSSSHEPPRGIGLHEVLGTISDLGGILRVRTGRLHLYRDFTELPYDPRHSSDEPFLQDWKNRLGLTEAPHAAGTSYTILFPLPYG